MARFFGSVKGSRNEITRLGSKASGLTTVAAGWKGAIHVNIEDREGRDYVVVSRIPWENSDSREIETVYQGYLEF